MFACKSIHLLSLLVFLIATANAAQDSKEKVQDENFDEEDWVVIDKNQVKKNQSGSLEESKLLEAKNNFEKLPWLDVASLFFPKKVAKNDHEEGHNDEENLGQPFMRHQDDPDDTESSAIENVEDKKITEPQALTKPASTETTTDESNKPNLNLAEAPLTQKFDMQIADEQISKHEEITNLKIEIANQNEPLTEASLHEFDQQSSINGAQGNEAIPEAPKSPASPTLSSTFSSDSDPPVPLHEGESFSDVFQRQSESNNIISEADEPVTEIQDEPIKNEELILLKDETTGPLPETPNTVCQNDNESIKETKVEPTQSILAERFGALSASTIDSIASLLLQNTATVGDDTCTIESAVLFEEPTKSAETVNSVEMPLAGSVLIESVDSEHLEFNSEDFNVASGEQQQEKDVEENQRILCITHVPQAQSPTIQSDTYSAMQPDSFSASDNSDKDEDVESEKDEETENAGKEDKEVSENIYNSLEDSLLLRTELEDDFIISNPSPLSNIAADTVVEIYNPFRPISYSMRPMLDRSVLNLFDSPKSYDQEDMLFVQFSPHAMSVCLNALNGRNEIRTLLTLNYQSSPSPAITYFDNPSINISQVCEEEENDAAATNKEETCEQNEYDLLQQDNVDPQDKNPKIKPLQPQNEEIATSEAAGMSEQDVLKKPVGILKAKKTTSSCKTIMPIHVLGKDRYAPRPLLKDNTKTNENAKKENFKKRAVKKKWPTAIASAAENSALAEKDDKLLKSLKLETSLEKQYTALLTKIYRKHGKNLKRKKLNTLLMQDILAGKMSNKLREFVAKKISEEDGLKPVVYAKRVKPKPGISNKKHRLQNKSILSN